METNIIDRGRGPEIKGTRITIYDVYHYLESGDWREAEIADILGLSEDQLTAAIRYIDANRTEVLRVHREIEERIARANPPEIEAKLAQSQKKREELAQRLLNAKNQGKNGVGNSGGR